MRKDESRISRISKVGWAILSKFTSEYTEIQKSIYVCTHTKKNYTQVDACTKKYTIGQPKVEHTSISIMCPIIVSEGSRPSRKK